MDLETESVLLPQIAEESLAVAIADAVRALNRKVSNKIAKTTLLVASSSSLDEDALLDQLREATLDHLLEHHFAAQTDFMGEDWAQAIREDIVRYCQDERMSALDRFGAAADACRVREMHGGVPVEIAWIEPDERLGSAYPALLELVKQLHTLPFELNGGAVALGLMSCLIMLTDKARAGSAFLQPSKGCTMLVRYPAGSSQATRLDSRDDGGQLDSGIR